MKSSNELKVEFINVFGYDFKLEQVNTGTYQIIDDCDRIWKEDIDLKNKEDYNLVNAVINHKDFFLSLYGFLYNYHSIFTDAKNEYIDIIDHKLTHTSLFSSEKGLDFSVALKAYYYDYKINLQFNIDYNWTDKTFSYKIAGWTEEPKVFDLGNDLRLYINNESFEPYKVVFERQDIDVSVFEPEMVIALERIACTVA